MTRKDQFRITIRLSDLQAKLMALWLSRFLQNAAHIWADPKLTGNVLSIHPADFPNLLSQAVPEDCTELEFYRIRKQGATTIASTLKKQNSKLSFELQDMVIGALSGLAQSKLCEDDSSGIHIDGLLQ